MDLSYSNDFGRGQASSDAADDKDRCGELLPSGNQDAIEAADNLAPRSTARRPCTQY
jgi:hypothetical protein